MDNFVINGASARMSARGDGPSGGGTSKPAVFHRDSNSKRVQRSNSNLSATSVTASASGGSLIGVGESKFVREKRKMALRKREVDIAKGKAVGVEVRIPMGTNSVDELESVSSAGVVSESPRSSVSSSSPEPLANENEMPATGEGVGNKANGEFSGDDSPWYKMMMEAYADVRDEDEKQSDEQDPIPPQQRPLYRNDITETKLKCTTTKTPQVDSNKSTPKTKRKQVKLGRTTTPSTLVSDARGHPDLEDDDNHCRGAEDEEEEEQAAVVDPTCVAANDMAVVVEDESASSAVVVDGESISRMESKIQNSIIASKNRLADMYYGNVKEDEEDLDNGNKDPAPGDDDNAKIEEVDLGSYGAYAFGPSGADDACLNNNPEVALTNLQLNGGGGGAVEKEGEDYPASAAVQPMSRPTSSRSTMTSSSSGSSCTLPFSASSSRPQTADCNGVDAREANDKVGSYGDILNVLQRMEQEEDGVEQELRRSQNGGVQSVASIKSTAQSLPPHNQLRRGNNDDDIKRSHRRDGEHRRASSKMSNLISYLDQFEDDRNTYPFPLAGDLKSRENVKIAELARQSSTRLAEQVIGLQYEVEEKERAVTVLKQALDHQRKLSANFSNRFQKELKSRLHTQKCEYEAAITRHQNFIDQLIEDKKNLSERCDAANKEVKANEKKYQDTLKTVEQRHAAEIKRLKSLQESSNKLKQEKWVDEKTRRIKEQTVRGLEPEIQRLMARHTAELANLESERERQLAAQERELHQRHLLHCRELRDSWEREHQESIGRERQILGQRHNQQLDEVGTNHAEEIERLQEQLRRERVRNSDERSHYEKEAEQIRRIAADRAQAEIDRIKEEEDNKRNIIVKKHTNELNALREAEDEERVAYERECRVKMEDEWKAREAVLRGKFKSERDEELDRAVDRLEAEVTRGRKEVEQEFTERIRRLREKYEGELEDASREIEVHKSKFCKARDDFVAKEEEFIVLSAVVKQKEVTLTDLEKVNQRLETERDDIRNIVRGEFASALDSLTEERTNLLNQLAEMRLKLAEAKSELETTEKQWKYQAEEEAERIHSKVRQAIERKDEALLEMRRNYERVLDQCNHLETLLHRQTKETYVKPNGNQVQSKP